MSDYFKDSADDSFLDSADDSFLDQISAIVDTPVIDPTSGEYLASQLITITCGTSGATIYYTEDGSTPDNTDTEYTAPFALSSAKTIKAIGIKAGLTDSDIVTEIYTIATQQPIITILT